MSYKDKLKELPQEEWENTNGLIVDTITIIITNRKHDSGYKIYESYGYRAKDGYHKKIGCHDVIDFVNYGEAEYMDYSISVDSEETGMFRIFNHCGQFKIIHSLSSLVIMPIRGEK